MKVARPLALAAASLLILPGSTALGAEPPPDLGGQFWRASADVSPEHGEPGAPGDVVTTLSRTCNPFGNATLSMFATGTAEGPYPGPFEAELSVLMGDVVRPGTTDNRDVESATGTFSVDSEAGQVEGTVAFDRTLTPAIGDPTRSGATGWCLNEPESPNSTTVTPQTSLGGAMTSYEATITTPDGCVYTDHGGDSDPEDGTVLAGAFEMRDAPFPAGRTLAQGFQSDGAPLETSEGCDAGFEFDGFFAPVDNPPTLNTVYAGALVPFRFSLGGYQGRDIFAAGYPRSQRVDCAQIANAAVDGVEETTPPGSWGLVYNPLSDRYVYVWKTSSRWDHSCRQFVMKLTDGSVHRANFRFR